jgi:hypothetical protein
MISPQDCLTATVGEVLRLPPLTKPSAPGADDRRASLAIHDGQLDPLRKEGVFKA